METHSIERYTSTAAVLHAIMALLIIGGFALGIYMVDLPFSPQKLKFYSWHKWLGITVFILAALRLLWRLTHRPPALTGVKPWEASLAHAAHITLYVLFFAIPITGWLMSSAKGFPTVYLGLIQLPDLVQKNKELGDILKNIHMYANYGLAAIVFAHIAGALKHAHETKGAFLKRMVPGK
jgi:cytochrome b561